MNKKHNLLTIGLLSLVTFSLVGCGKNAYSDAEVFKDYVEPEVPVETSYEEDASDGYDSTKSFADLANDQSGRAMEIEKSTPDYSTGLKLGSMADDDAMEIGWEDGSSVASSSTFDITLNGSPIMGETLDSALSTIHSANVSYDGSNRFSVYTDDTNVIASGAYLGEDLGDTVDETNTDEYTSKVVVDSLDVAITGYNVSGIQVGDDEQTVKSVLGTPVMMDTLNSQVFYTYNVNGVTMDISFNNGIVVKISIQG